MPAIDLSELPGFSYRPLPEGRSPTGAINDAVKQASGSYIAMAWPETIWSRGKLSMQIRILEEHADCAAVFTQLNCIDDHCSRLLRSRGSSYTTRKFGNPNHSQAEWIRFLWDDGPCLPSCTMLIRKDALDDGVLYNESHPLVREEEFLLRLCSCNNVHFLKQTLVRTYENQLSVHFDPAWQISYSKMLHCFLEKISDDLFVEAFRDAFVLPEADYPPFLQIERALLLLRTEGQLTGLERQLGLEWLLDLLAKPEYHALLQEHRGRLVTAISQFSLKGNCYAAAGPVVSPLVAAFSAKELVSELLKRVQNKPKGLIARRGLEFLAQFVREQGRRALQRIRMRRANALARAASASTSSVQAGDVAPQEKIRILFVGIANSAHTYRWVSNLVGCPRYSLYFFPTYYIPETPNPFVPEDGVTFCEDGDLRAFIDEVRPHIIHTMHTQQAAYPMICLKDQLRKLGTVWMHSLWGSDLYFWGRYPEHKMLLRKSLDGIDVLLTEGKRDIPLAHNLGFHGKMIDSMPAFGGFDLAVIDSVKRVPPSQRKEICIKGYVDVVGRFFVGIRALELVRDLLDGYTVNVFSISTPSRSVAELFGIEHNIQVHLVERVSHDQILAMFARSRFCLSVSLSDGLPASLVEAMSMGAFPVQTNTSIADEWFEDGVSGLLIPPNDPDVIAKALRKALTDDALVDEAARINQRTIRTRLDRQTLAANILTMYDEVSRGRTVS
ncbi:glycosyltransferase [Desulfovibrio aerotolerans]|uniref:Glycosyltransferase n=1 Tax=Solidesulfovibrio aerotolerans TaxID=295255 RepID=A0A7C9NM40_9BACT|nr:glycosyltransferase family 4 protein [Solidesulfovibrio aerotolerans]MYL85156.1 glycosyltransferase [Solidesulfovibrio aerotolerans]